jgi:Holliday junction resolvasome RuvABC endonuclease subunit
MKNLPPSVILGVDTGARQIGFAVFKGKELISYSVKTIKDKSDLLSLAKMRWIIREILREYEVTKIVLEKIVFVQQHRTFVKVVYDNLKTCLKDLSVPYIEYNPKAIREALCENEKPTKATIALLLAEKYPELSRYFNAPKIWQKRYYSLLLGAVAIGYFHTHEAEFEIDSESDLE